MYCTDTHTVSRYNKCLLVSSPSLHIFSLQIDPMGVHVGCSCTYCSSVWGCQLLIHLNPSPTLQSVLAKPRISPYIYMYLLSDIDFIDKVKCKVRQPPTLPFPRCASVPPKLRLAMRRPILEKWQETDTVPNKWIDWPPEFCWVQHIHRWVTEELSSEACVAKIK